MEKLNIEGFEGFEWLLTPFDDDEIINDDESEQDDPFAPEDPKPLAPVEIPDLDEIFS